VIIASEKAALRSKLAPDQAPPQHRAFCFVCRLWSDFVMLNMVFAAAVIID